MTIDLVRGAFQISNIAFRANASRTIPHLIHYSRNESALERYSKAWPGCLATERVKILEM